MSKDVYSWQHVLRVSWFSFPVLVLVHHSHIGVPPTILDLYPKSPLRVTLSYQISTFSDSPELDSESPSIATCFVDQDFSTLAQLTFWAILFFIAYCRIFGSIPGL